MLRTPDTDASSEGSDDLTDLTVGLHTRISPGAEEMIKDRARMDGVKAATWVRLRIYEALGIMKRRGRK
jgi:hypothetical protein